MDTSATRTLNIRIPTEQYEELEEIVQARHYTSKAEYIRELLRNSLDEYANHISEKAARDRSRHISIDDYAKNQGLE